MKLQYFFGCILAAASLAVWPEIGLAHGGGGHGGGGGGNAFVGGGGHGFGGAHAFGGFTGRAGFSGTRGFSTGGFSGRGDHGHFSDRGFRGRDRDFRDRRFRDFGGDSFDFGFYGFAYPDYYPYDYPYYYAYPYDAYQRIDNSRDYRTSRSGDVTSAVQSALTKRGYYRGPIDGIIGAGSRRAIRAFQTDQGLPVTGLIDRKLISALQLGWEQARICPTYISTNSARSAAKRSFMVIVGETNRNKLANTERPASGEGPDKLPSHKVIDFEAGRKALEQGRLKQEQSRARLVERIRLPRLSGDLLEFSLTMAIFFALLFGLYVGLIGSWRFWSLSTEIFVGEHRGSLPRSPGFSNLFGIEWIEGN
jgi:hypothetical protein